nr:polyadenylate-binding protein 2 isoform X1 [Ipomoea batatas]
MGNSKGGVEEVEPLSVFVGNVMRKRKNVPGMKQRRPRHFNPYVAYGYEPSVPPYFYSPYGVYGKVPRFRRPTRYMPYY